MSKIFRQSTREAVILSKIESSLEHARRTAIARVKDHSETLSNAIAMKLVETNLVETTSKNSLEDQIQKCLGKLIYAEDFDIDYQIAPFRSVVPHPNTVSLYITAFVIEKLLNHKDVVDIFGSDVDIYSCIHRQVVHVLGL
jgi:hypothetical protein